MTKKELNRLLFNMDIYTSRLLEGGDTIDDDTHFVNAFGETVEIETNELSESEVRIALMAKQTELLSSIKGMVKFFTVITVIGIILSVIL